MPVVPQKIYLAEAYNIYLDSIFDIIYYIII